MAHPDIVVEKNLRAYPGVERGSTEWEETYKIRVNVEKSINHFKEVYPCFQSRLRTCFAITYFNNYVIYFTLLYTIL